MYICACVPACLCDSCVCVFVQVSTGGTLSGNVFNASMCAYVTIMYRCTICITSLSVYTDHSPSSFRSFVAGLPSFQLPLLPSDPTPAAGCQRCPSHQRQCTLARSRHALLPRRMGACCGEVSPRASGWPLPGRGLPPFGSQLLPSRQHGEFHRDYERVLREVWKAELWNQTSSYDFSQFWLWLM